MGYEIHIRRIANGVSLPISHDEWTRAVLATDGVRPSVHDSEEPDFSAVEVFFKEKPGWKIEGIWQSAIYFDDGQANIKGAKTTVNGALDGNDPLAAATSRLAKALEATVQGDEEEVYDLLGDTADYSSTELKEEGSQLRKLAGGLLTCFGTFGLWRVMSVQPMSWISGSIWLTCICSGLYLLGVFKLPGKK